MTNQEGAARWEELRTVWGKFPDSIDIISVYKKDSARWAAFAKRLAGLKKLSWAADGLLIRPPADAGELVAEGKALNHCVGRYVDRMARGETVILLIRRASEPDRPYYTLEWRGGRVIQCQTKNNSSYERSTEVRGFVERWVERMAAKGAQKSRPEAGAADQG